MIDELIELLEMHDTVTFVLTGVRVTTRKTIEFKDAIEALKKQIPQKPLHLHKNYYCPVCKEDGWVMWDDAIPTDMDNYCCVCGQRLDWSEDE